MKIVLALLVCLAFSPTGALGCDRDCMDKLGKSIDDMNKSMQPIPQSPDPANRELTLPRDQELRPDRNPPVRR